MKRVLVVAAVLLAVAAGLLLAANSVWYDNLYPATNAMGWPNAYRPTSPTNVTVGAGIDLGAELEASGMPKEMVESIKKDINGNPRPPGRWDVGAYQYPQPPKPPPPPGNLHISGVSK